MKEKVSCRMRMVGAGAVVVLVALSIACGGGGGSSSYVSNGSGATGGSDFIAVLTVASSDFQSGDVYTVGAVKERTVSGGFLPSSTSDQVVVSYGDDVYIIRRYGADNIIKTKSSSVGNVQWQYSINGPGETNANPQWMSFVSDTKAYVTRMGYNTLWVVDPSAAAESEFKVGEVDLSPLLRADDTDDLVEMYRSIIVGGRLYVLLQCFDRNKGWDALPAVIAVVDVKTDELVDVDPATPGIQGISLKTCNPQEIEYVPALGCLFVVSSGEYPGWDGSPAEYTGGIEKVDLSTYETTVVVEDDDAGTPLYGGNIFNFVIVSSTKGYFAVYRGWGDNVVYSFDPSTGKVSSEPMAALQNTGIMDLAVDPLGYVWGLDMGNRQVVVLNPSDDTVDEVVDLGLAPYSITFAGL